MTLVHPYLKLPQLRSFPRPTGLRQTLNTQQQATTGERYVKSEDELLAAIGEVTSRYKTNDAGFPEAMGGGITIAAAFALTRTPIVIPPRCVFLKIRAVPGASLLPTSVDQGTLFNVQAAYVGFSNIVALYGAEGSTWNKWFNTFVTTTVGDPVDGLQINPSSLILRDCTAFTDMLFVDGTTDDARNTLIENCLCEDANPAHAACVSFASKFQQAVGCELSNGGGDTVTIGAGAESCVVERCNLNSGDVTSTASDGENRIWSNTRTGTLALHGTDSSGGNT